MTCDRHEKVTYTISKSHKYENFLKFYFYQFKLFQKVPFFVEISLPLVKYINHVFGHPVPVS